MTRNPSEAALLGLLSLRPMSGYDIRKTTRESIGHFWSESYGQIYPTLGRLERRGLVRRLATRGRGRRVRQLYALTPRGQHALEQWLALAPHHRPFRSELLLKLFFGRRLPRNVAAGHVREFLARQETFLRVYDAVERQLRAEHARHPDLPFWLMTLSYGRHMARVLRDWCGETLAALAPRSARAKKAG